MIFPSSVVPAPEDVPSFLEHFPRPSLLLFCRHLQCQRRPPRCQRGMLRSCTMVPSSIDVRSPLIFGNVSQTCKKSILNSIIPIDNIRNTGRTSNCYLARLLNNAISFSATSRKDSLLDPSLLFARDRLSRRRGPSPVPMPNLCLPQKQVRTEAGGGIPRICPLRVPEMRLVR